MQHRSVPLALAWNILEYQSKKFQPTLPIHAEIIHITLSIFNTKGMYEIYQNNNDLFISFILS